MKTTCENKTIIPISVIDNVYDLEKIIACSEISGEFFSVVMYDKSLEPRVCEGDLMIFKNQNTIESGDVALVLVNNESLLCRRVTVTPEGLVLSPFNMKFECEFYSFDKIEDKSVRILGKGIEFRRYFISGVVND